MGFGFNASSKTIAAATAQTIVFNDNEIPNGDLQNIFIETTGANNSLTNAITRVRVKLSGAAIIDCTAAQLRALIEALAPANTIPVAARLRFTIPLSLPGYKGNIGIPMGQKVTVEIVLDANSSAGTAVIGWQTLNGVAPQFVPTYVGQADGVAASTNNGRLNINRPGELVMGVSVPVVGATGITRKRTVLSGVEIYHADQALLLEGQFLRNPQSLTTTLFVLYDAPLPGQTGQSFIEFDKGAGGAATDEWALLTLVPQERAA